MGSCLHNAREKLKLPNHYNAMNTPAGKCHEHRIAIRIKVVEDGYRLTGVSQQ